MYKLVANSQNIAKSCFRNMVCIVSFSICVVNTTVLFLPALPFFPLFAAGKPVTLFLWDWWDFSPGIIVAQAELPTAKV